MQDVLDREADRAMHLMGDRAALFRGFRTSGSRGRRFKKRRIVERGAVGNGIRRRGRSRERRRRFPANLARLCCTAWNFDIFFSKATRSLE